MSEGVPEGASLPEGIDVDDTAAYFGVTKSSDVLQQLMEMDSKQALSKTLEHLSDVVLQPGEFKIYGNKASTTLSNTVLDDINLILLPNPSLDFITINKDADLIEIYDVTGKKLLSFNNVLENQQLDINQLQTGYYVVKVYDNEYVESRNLIKK